MSSIEPATEIVKSVYEPNATFAAGDEKLIARRRRAQVTSDGLDPARGIFVAVTAGAGLWVLILGAYRLMSGTLS